MKQIKAKLLCWQTSGKAMVMAWDRTELFKSHDGPNVLPNSPFFTKLLRHAHRDRFATRDRNDGDISKTYRDLLTDACTLRAVMRRNLSSEVNAGLIRGDEIYVGILAAGSYEFTVAMIAILAIGAAAVPMSELSLIAP